MDKIKQLEKQIIKERKELHKLDGMDWFIKAARICNLYKSIQLHILNIRAIQDAIGEQVE